MARKNGTVDGSLAVAPAGAADVAAAHNATPDSAWLDECFSAAEAQLATLLQAGGSSSPARSRQAGPLPVSSLPGVDADAALAACPAAHAQRDGNNKPARIPAHCNGRPCKQPAKHTSIRSVAEAAAMAAMPAAARASVLLVAST